MRKRKDAERRFYELVLKAAKVHPNTWCVRRMMTVPTIAIKAMKCWECPEFVLNGGICDPL